MKEYTTVSVINNNKIIQRGILLLNEDKYYVIYSPGEVTTWFLLDEKKQLFMISYGSRRNCPKILEFDEYLSNIKRSTKSIKCNIDKVRYNTFIKIDCFYSVYYRDKSGLELYGVCLRPKINDNINSIVIYDGSRLSVWEKTNDTLKETKNYIISSNPGLIDLIDSTKVNIVEKIEYLSLSNKDQNKVSEFENIKNKILLNNRIKDLSKFLDKNGFLEDLVRLTESVGNAYPQLIYGLLEIYKLK